MDNDKGRLTEHYAGGDVFQRVLKALAHAGLDEEDITREVLERFDHLHFGGLDATRQLASLAGLEAGMYVLDVGSGVGGPARTLAAEYGCRVVGLDLTEEYVRAAEQLTAMVGMNAQVSFRQGDALEMPFADGEFDVVWLQSALMNIPHKPRLVEQVRRVLRPGGLAAIEGAFQGTTPGLYLPIYWASEPESNDLVTPEEFEAMMQAAGFSQTAWENVSGDPADPAANPAAAETISAHVFYENADERARNYRRSWQEGMIVTLQTVWKLED